MPLLLFASCGLLFGDEPRPPALRIQRTTNAIAVDGTLTDAGWHGATTIQTWYETSPGDNTVPAVRTTGYLTYDDRFLYVGLELFDPSPKQIRAPLGVRDSVGPDADYGGVILDTEDDGKRAIMLLVNARGIQYDAVVDDAVSTRDASPDFYWDSQATITKEGWTLELRIPLSSLRYERRHPTWRMMLVRNYPRDFRYQIYSSRLPRGSPCFVCHAHALTGFESLPSSSHLVIAPYLNATQTMRSQELSGTRMVSGPVKPNGGIDLKWTPAANAAVDATINPDFSQIESDALKIVANERFAISYPERRPFFLEGVDLLATPITVVHTRTITSPGWGLRITGRGGSTAYTTLLAEDRGGGSVTLPQSNATRFASQDYKSFVAIGRLRRDIADSYVGAVFTAREVSGGGYNRILGPDFRWRHNRDRITGQFVVSQTLNPNRPELTPEWIGQKHTSYAADVWFARNSRTVDWFGSLTDIGNGFRADAGFVPQAGFRKVVGELGYSFHPEGFVRRIRPSMVARHSADEDRNLLARELLVRVSLDGRWNSRMDLSLNVDRVRALERTLPRHQVRFSLSANPSRLLSDIAINGFAGEEIDFDNARTGSGASIVFGVGLRPAIKLELRVSGERRWLNVNGNNWDRPRLFTAEVTRVRTTYTFSARTFLRGVAEYNNTRRDPSLYRLNVSRKSGGLSASTLFGYKLNWQTVLFVGYGDERAITDADSLRPLERQFFVKVSYAFQW